MSMKSSTILPSANIPLLTPGQHMDMVRYARYPHIAVALDELARNALFKAYTANPLLPMGCASTSELRLVHILTMSSLLDAVAILRGKSVPEIDGAYNCYLDPVSSRQLFSDPDFQVLFQGATSANQVFKKGMTNDFLGLRFVPVTETNVTMHPTLPGVMVRRVVVCGKGALVEAPIAGMDDDDGIDRANALVTMVDGVAMVTRATIERPQKIIAQSWYWIGGFAAPADITSGEPVYKRAVILEHVG